MSYSIIAAVGKNRELGKNNGLIWHLPNDLKYFRSVTDGKTIIMGRRTFESLPRILPNRHHVVLSLGSDFPDEVERFTSLDNLFEKYDKIKEEVFVIGGESIFSSFIHKSDKLYLTEIDAECFDADAYFPLFDKNEYDRVVLGNNSDNGINYEHVLYRKK